MRKLTAILASLILASQLMSCTSSDSQQDGSGDQSVSESTEAVDGELAELDKPIPAEGAPTEDVAVTDGFLDEQLPADALGEAPKSSTPPPSDIVDTAPPPDMETPPSIADASPASQVDTGMSSSPSSSVDVATSNDLSASSSLDSGSSVGSVSSTEPMDSSSGMNESPAPKKKKASSEPKLITLKKIESSPITRDGVLLNTVYIARNGDNFRKISSMIYGDESKHKELKRLNPGVGPKVGDKVYYNSPLRSADDTKLITFYEDKGIVNGVYVAKEGDTIKKVGKELLGSKDSWKELWATNSLEGTGKLEAGTEIKYWKYDSGAMPGTSVAHNNLNMETAPPPVAEMPPPPAEMAPPPPVAEMPPPPAEMAPPPVAEMPPPPPPAEMAPPPPPPPAEMAPPPPPVAKTAPPMEENPEGAPMDQDMMMGLAGVGVVAAAIALLVIVRKRRQNREMAAAFNDTQVGT